ncbi:thiamine pyrophosphate-dependent dehydrogenase E1 component subunit alpha [Seongchinamella sediminis]|uniref:2-oxoisovalerate dehydrogenase subunit alpha n=1 Tax=Seongchinamella sediminis TaxID=2283635 RepID=A0A3L7E2M2_9GAMM|nr:thiamine pyrophosphate-dependent dehydrogenase E1 component subunit alpha [Seongchinamella sediminis]RLQ22571.1 thiamine pyrophosphate-dependent dehydrogenase E1 component subunit alpha [Seongchinamella sediminis]
MKHSKRSVHQPEFISGSDLPIPTLEILRADGTLYEGAEAPDLSRDLAIRIYRTMIFTRILDERMISAQRQGRLSFYLTCAGEEAAVAGSVAAFDEGDMIMGQYREQAALRFRGFTARQFMTQLLSTRNDLGKGRQMPVHYGSRELNFMTISSPLATQIPQAAGYAYGQRLDAQGEALRHCTLCYYGDGAASEGDFHAGMNMAAVLKCPVVFFCRNNGYAISTPTAEQYAGDGIASRGVGYGMQTIRVDGNDLLAVYAASVAARRIAVESCEPVLIEAMSYRLGAHSTSDDPSGYRSREEEDRWREMDPIERMRLWLQARDWWSESEEKEALESYRSEVLRELKAEEKEPGPPLSEMAEDVYDTPPWHLREQMEALAEHVRQYPDHYPHVKGA